MDLTLKPQIQRFIQEQIEAGNFPNAEAVIEAATCAISASRPCEAATAMVRASPKARAPGPVAK